MGFPLEPAKDFAEELFKAIESGLPVALYPHSIVGEDVSQRSVFIRQRNTGIKLHTHFMRESELIKLRKYGKKCEGAVVVDFSHPSKIESNLTSYCALGIPSVICTLGGRKNRMDEIVADLGGCAVIASGEVPTTKEIFKAMDFIIKNIQPGRIYSIEEATNGNKKL